MLDCYEGGLPWFSFLSVFLFSFALFHFLSLRSILSILIPECDLQDLY